MAPQEIITFWFEEIDSSLWWIKDDGFDALIQRRFKKIHQQAANNELFSWRSTALGSLAEIIILDQFSRNMYRDTPNAFAFDNQALCLSQFAIEKGYDLALKETQRSFMYLPFMHSESPLIHQEAIILYQKLGNEGNLSFELKHKMIIDRFGRYPHRNHILGRQSTPEEIEFLKEPNSSF